jgi:hypothetical protein
MLVGLSANQVRAPETCMCIYQDKATLFLPRSKQFFSYNRCNRLDEFILTDLRTSPAFSFDFGLPSVNHQADVIAISILTIVQIYNNITHNYYPPTMPSKPTSPTNPKRLALQQYWHESGFTGIYLRATLRTMQFASAIIIIGIYGSELHYRSKSSDTPITNEMFALVVGLLSVFTVGLHCFLTVKRVPWVLWDFAMCVLYAALAGTFGGTYLISNNELLPENRVKSVEGMKAAFAFDLFGLVLWLFTFLQGSIWCCKARRFTRRTDVEEASTEASAVPAMAEHERPRSSEETLYADSMTKYNETVTNEIC